MKFWPVVGLMSCSGASLDERRMLRVRPYLEYGQFSRSRARFPTETLTASSPMAALVPR